MTQLDKDSKSSIMELCRRVTGQYLTRVSDSSQVGAMIVAVNQGSVSIFSLSIHVCMITARAEQLKDVKNHAMARLRAYESHNLVASALVVLCAWHFCASEACLPVRHASQCSVVRLTQK